MADQLPLSTPDPNAATAAQETAATPAAVTQVQVAAKPKKQGQQHQQQGKRKGIIEIPEAAFKARVQREAAAEIRRRTGVPIEEAERLIKAGGGAQAASAGKTAAAATADAAVAQLRAENEKLRKHNERISRESAQAAKKAEKRIRNANDARVEAELRAEARLAGITDPDYAVNLFARAVGKDATLQPEAFFAGLKETHPVLFANAATPVVPKPKVVVPPTTTPPESTATGEVKPQPAQAGTPTVEKNAEEDSPQEFAARQRSYGYVPGM